MKRRDDRGSASVEAAIAVPAFALFVGLIIFGGRTAVVRHSVESAAADAARSASILRVEADAKKAAKDAAVANLTWLPATCAYRLVAEGRDLYWWHHLVSGSPETVHQAGVSIRYKTISEDDIDEEDLPDRITEWGGEG